MDKRVVWTHACRQNRVASDFGPSCVDHVSMTLTIELESTQLSFGPTPATKKWPLQTKWPQKLPKSNKKTTSQKCGLDPRLSTKSCFLFMFVGRNQKADHLANVVLEQSTSWACLEQTLATGGRHEHGRYLLSSDGGYKDGVGAAAYAMFCLDTSEIKTCAHAGTFLQKCRSAFEAELIALDVAVQTFVDKVLTT